MIDRRWSGTKTFQDNLSDKPNCFAKGGLNSAKEKSLQFNNIVLSFGYYT